MNEILQKRIEEAVKKTACPQCVFNDGGTCNNDDDCKLFDDFVGLMTFILQNQWISVGEGLPIIGKDGYVDVFIIIKKNKKTLTYTARFEDNKFWNIDGFGVYQGVTHWMEIPSLEGGEK